MTEHRTPRRWRVLALSGLAAIALAGCTSGSDSTSTVAEAPAWSAPAAAPDRAEAGGMDEAAPAEEEAAQEEAAPEASGESGSGSDSSGTESGAGADAAPLEPTVVSADRDVIRTASVEVIIEVAATEDDEADEKALRQAITDAALRTRALVGAEGYVGATESSGRVAVVTLRIPASGYQSAIESLSTLGEVSSLQEQAQDVTAQMVDLESRVKTMSAGVERVRALVAEATDLETVVSLEAELSRREADLESIEQQRAALAGQAALSTVTVTLTGRIVGIEEPVVEEPAPVEEATGFLGGLGKGWDAFVGLGTGVLAVIGAVLPFVPVIAVVVLLGWLLFRTISRRTAPAVPALVGHPQPTPTPAPTSTTAAAEEDLSR